MLNFSELLKQAPVILDGATGSNLMKAGMPKGVCTEDWILRNPQSLLDLQQAYIDAGSQIIYAPTFSANRHGLARHGFEGRVVELNTALVQLSKQAADGKALVAGDMTTTGIPLEPLGTMAYDELFEIYCEQASVLAEAGADLLVIETMLGIDETAVALEAAKSVCELPVMCSVTVQADGGLYFGGNCIEAVQTLQELGVDAVGINCSLGPEQLVALVRNMKAEATVPLLVKPNAGMPEISDSGEAIYPMQPEIFAKHMQVLMREGAELIGGCCGTTPEFIAAIKKYCKNQESMI
ncbi:MAG: homocysteine S-methyltransferase family protein [Ruminococcaceae bacterium]|nr:homocysteine S-methyltransferase family protein [Oscillospiraceae bacterium]